MNADEWFAPQSLSKMVDVACDAAADMVIPTASLDRYDAHRERHSRVLDATSLAIDDRASLAAGLSQMISGGLIAQTPGVMYSRSLFETCLSRDRAFRSIGFMTCALSQAQCISGCGDACFHAVAPRLTGAFDPTLFPSLPMTPGRSTELIDSLAEANR